MREQQDDPGRDNGTLFVHDLSGYKFDGLLGTCWRCH